MSKTLFFTSRSLAQSRLPTLRNSDQEEDLAILTFTVYRFPSLAILPQLQS